MVLLVPLFSWEPLYLPVKSPGPQFLKTPFFIYQLVLVALGTWVVGLFSLPIALKLLFLLHRNIQTYRYLYFSRLIRHLEALSYWIIIRFTLSVSSYVDLVKRIVSSAKKMWYTEGTFLALTAPCIFPCFSACFSNVENASAHKRNRKGERGSFPLGWEVIFWDD